MIEPEHGPEAAKDAQTDAVGFVLAGGQSTRMGEDKALIRLADEPLVVRALGVLREAGLNASIAGARSSLTDFAPVIQDARPDLGPLAGICSALVSTAAQYVAFLPVDLPLLPASLVKFLLHHARVAGGAVTLPSVGGFAQTFPAVVDRAALPALEAALRAGQGGCFSAFKSAAAQTGRPFSVVAVELLVQSGQVDHPKGLPAVFWFKNVNTPEDLERTEAILTQSHRVS